MSTRDGGKGDQQRPLGIPAEEFDANWNRIFKNGIPTLEELEKQRNKLADKLVKQIEENLRQQQYITPED